MHDAQFYEHCHINLKAFHMYEIVYRVAKDSKVIAELDGKSPAAVPSYLRIGVGEKKFSYFEFLETAFTTNTELLLFVARLHARAKKNGTLHIRCTCKQSFHAEMFGRFMKLYDETFDDMMPYLFSDMGFTAKDAIAREKQAEIRARLREKIPKFFDMRSKYMNKLRIVDEFALDIEHEELTHAALSLGLSKPRESINKAV